MQKQILAAGFYLLSLIFPLKVLAKDYDEIYVFGDSFSDTGNVFNATNGIVPPNPPYFNERFSNGSVWVEYLASDLGLTFNPKTNFAFGGATTGLKNIGISTLPGLQQQINSFTKANPSADPNSLYILWAGVNDYLDYFFQSTPNPTQSVTNLSTAVKSLAAVGAKDIMVLNLPDLGKFPVTSGNSQISSLLSTFTSKHNSNLTTNLKLLSQELNPNVNIIPLDVNSLFNQIIAKPEEFNLTNGTDSCIGDSPVVSIEITTQPVMCISDKFLFWDEVHPTTAAHQLIGKLAFSALEPIPVPEPSAVLGVLVFSVGAVSLQKRK
ncbi:SGNH/GDSL hydrolase family protein [Nostoc sp. ChiSLP03a]|uniref:SGNH/GDSL hydrolase family protein n=1 Tax=Nostoc sp. ChiSLP03a TaxID=3075380 RepID=UPI002AD4ECCA|nr:SGNH/GDSL hydrolase family protein [Nostoc sp. ChiSLP03a]MDZ8213370.1 SGNH/GDSL hydrolase family protein [Nostoc sp. ChiSLP03a]